MLREEVIRLGPWHIDIDISPEVSTRAFLDAGPGTYPKEFGKVSFYDPREGFLRRLRRAFPDGLAGRTVLDCACNCGAHLFYAKEAGAGRCFGFDVREHWIEQARFLADQRRPPAGDIGFEVADLYDLPALELQPFDVTFFFGIFYHLPEPVTGLKLACDLTRELLVLRTATKAARGDGALVVHHESATQLMSGAYGIGWHPTGPAVLTRILTRLGFPEVRCSLWRHAPKQGGDLDLLELFAARTPGYFDAWDAGVGDGHAAVAEQIETCVPPGATVLVMGNDTRPEVHSRKTIPFTGAPGELESRLREGARYLVVPAQTRLAEHPEPARDIERYAQLLLDGSACRVFDVGLTAARGHA